MATIPDKRYFKIGEVSRLAQVAPHVLRYWESEFTGIKPKRANSGQRLYRKVDVELILSIKDLLHNQGYTISGARRHLSTKDKKPQRSKKKRPPGNCLQNIKTELEAIQSLLSARPKRKARQRSPRC